MTTNNKPKNSAREASGLGLGITAVVAAVTCCGLPALIGAGALGAVGGLLRRPWVVASALVLVVAVVVYYARRRCSAAACCPRAAHETTDTSIRHELLGSTEQQGTVRAYGRKNA